MSSSSSAGSIRLLSMAAIAIFAVAGAEFPQHPDLRLKSVSEPGVGAYLMTYQTGGNKGEAVGDWLKTHYSRDGWTIDTEHGASRFTAGKGDHLQAVVNVTDTQYATIVSITAWDRS